MSRGGWSRSRWAWLTTAVVGGAITAWIVAAVADRGEVPAVTAATSSRGLAVPSRPSPADGVRRPALEESSPAQLAGAPAAIRALVDRFELGPEVAADQRLDRERLEARSAELGARRHQLELETARLDADHKRALEAGDRAAVVELRAAIVASVVARNRLSAELLILGYLRGAIDDRRAGRLTAPDPGT